MITATSNYLTALASFRAGKLYYAIEIDGYTRVFTLHDDGLTDHSPWITNIDSYSITINDLDGGMDQGSLSFYVRDSLGAITADFPDFVFEGKRMRIKQGFAGLDYSDYVTLFTGFVQDICSYNNNLEYQFDCSDTSSVLTQIIYQIGDDGSPTSGDHLKTVLGHPIDIIIDILENQCGLLSTDYNKTKLQTYRDGAFSGFKFEFQLDQAPVAGDFINAQLLKTLGGYRFTRADGTIDFNFPYPIAAVASVASLDKSKWKTIPTAEQIDLVNTIEYQFDKATGSDSTANSDYLATSTQEYLLSIGRYGQFGDQQIQADGMRSSFQGFFLAAFFSRLIFQRYGLKALKFDSDAAESIWNTILLEPGDIVDVTHPNIPDRANGVIGITAKLFEIFNKTINWMEGTVQYTMLDATYLAAFTSYYWAPNAHANYAASSTGDKARYMFLCNDSDQYSNGDPAHALG